MAGFFSSLTSAFQNSLGSPPKGIHFEPIPNFEAEGITDEDVIRENLRRGPVLSFVVNEEKTPFNVPLRLFLYYSPKWQQRIEKSGFTQPLKIPHHSAKIFSKYLTWLHQGRLCSDETTNELLEAIGTARSNKRGINNHADMLCWLHLFARDMAVVRLADQTLKDLGDLTSLVTDYGYPMPISPETVIAVYQRARSDSAIWKLVSTTMKTCFLNHPPSCLNGHGNKYEWDECFKVCTGLKVGIMDAVADRILDSWDMRPTLDGYEEQGRGRE